MTQYGAGAGAAPTCPRHPQTISYVRCQRCGRPVCPQCQRPAPVGVQCVDCVAEGQKKVRQTRTISGGKVRHGAPVITYSIIGICVALFIGQMADYQTVTGWLAFNPVLAAHEPWRFLTSAFLHGSIPHILFNMYALYLVGSQLERALGRWRFIALYLLSALGGSTAILLLAKIGIGSWTGWTVGASGAVFGLFAALALTMRKVGANESQILALIAINLALGFFISNVSWQGHIGGLITGGLLGAAYLFGPRDKRTQYSVWGTVGVAALLIGLIAVGL